MKNLYKFEWCTRGGCVRGVFLATAVEINAAIGQEVYLGECLGKHSEVGGQLGKDDLVGLTDDQEFIAKAVEYGLIPMGINPLEYIQMTCETCGECHNSSEKHIHDDDEEPITGDI